MKQPGGGSPVQPSTCLFGWRLRTLTDEEDWLQHHSNPRCASAGLEAFPLVEEESGLSPAAPAMCMGPPLCMCLPPSHLCLSPTFASLPPTLDLVATSLPIYCPQLPDDFTVKDFRSVYNAYISEVLSLVAEECDGGRTDALMAKVIRGGAGQFHIFAGNVV